MPSKSADLVYDVGMHKGEDSAFYLAKGFRVIGVEADPGLARHCRERFPDAIQRGRLVIVEGAVADPAAIAAGQKSLTFYSNLDDSVWGTAHLSWAERNQRLGTRIREIRVASIDFRDVLFRYGIPHFMKIDIEGADRFCLEALLDFDERPEYVSIESETNDRGRLIAEMDLLERLGYDSFQAVQQAWVPRQRPPDPAREGAYAAHVFEPGASGLFGAELPGPWVGREALLAEYRGIFRMYRLFGDRCILRKSRAGMKVLALLRKVSGQPLPGWYDTHARHRTVRA